MRFLWLSLVTALAVWITTLLPLDVEVEGGEDTWWTRALVFLFIGAIMAGVNLILRPFFTIVSIPLLILTLGLFFFVIAWGMLWITSWITGAFNFAELTIGSFWMSVLAAIVIAIFTGIFAAIIPAPAPRRAVGP